MFTKKVSKRSKKAMVQYLSNHYRYDTMNSWNNSTSYAHRVKIRNLDLPKQIQDIAYEMIETEEFWDSVNNVMEMFNRTHDYQYQMSFNGRSGGYIVLIQGGYKEIYIAKPDMKKGERDYSDAVGRWFDYEEAKENGWIGRKVKRIYTQPGKSLDMGEDFSEWSMAELKDRVELIQSFDEHVEEIRNLLIECCQNFTVEVETVMVPKSRKVLREVETC
jgi:hypothetical protein